MNTLKRFLSGTIHSVSEQALVQEVIDKINADKVSACLVEKEGEYIAIVTREDIIQKIPRVEVEKIAELVKETAMKVINKKLIVETCGSYRRGRENSGDVDVLISIDSQYDEI